jgi:hypothetical protein
MPRGGRVRGSKNRKTLEREKVKKLTAARAELAKNAPPIDFAASFDSLDRMTLSMMTELRAPQDLCPFASIGREP